jgi:hypothetical protein
MSIVNIYFGLNVHCKNGKGTLKCESGRRKGQGMGYCWRDLVVLGLARITGMRVITAHRIIAALGWQQR